MEKTINVGRELKYIKAPMNTFITANELKNIPPKNITILSTGSQGEPLAALSRIAEGTHQVKIIEGDTIVFSSSAIPGNQESINKTINKLYKAGANVIVNNPLTDTHTSGHASSAELQLMIDLCKPKYFMPVHGEYAMLKKHSDLAIETGMDPNKCFILKNGQVLRIDNNGKADTKTSVVSGISSIDRNNQIISQKIIEERKALSEDGVISLTFEIEKNHLLSKPHFVSSGFIYTKTTNELTNDIINKAYKSANSYLFKYHRFIEKSFKAFIQKQIESHIYMLTSMKPVVVITVIHI